MSKKKVKLFLTDCDGCLTDGGMYYTESGDEFKKFNTLDGMGFQLLREQGILTGIITRENTKIVARRADKLKVDFFRQGINDKLRVIKEICKDNNINIDNVVYVGDDVNDYDAIKAVGYGCCVNNAVEKVKKVSAYISAKNGGSGAVREIIDWVLMDDNA